MSFGPFSIIFKPTWKKIISLTSHNFNMLHLYQFQLERLFKHMPTLLQGMLKSTEAISIRLFINSKHCSELLWNFVSKNTIKLPSQQQLFQLIWLKEDEIILIWVKRGQKIIPWEHPRYQNHPTRAQNSYQYCFTIQTCLNLISRNIGRGEKEFDEQISVQGLPKYSGTPRCSCVQHLSCLP